jgi:pimeloyl-ACP methyl ester carboxylesterase
MRFLPRSVAGGMLLLLATIMLASCSAPPMSNPARVQAFKPLPPVESAADVAMTMPASARAPIAAAMAQPSANPPVAVVQPYVTPQRLDHGLTIVIVGVNGDNMLSAGLAPGLIEGGYPGAVEVVDWTTGYWPLFLYHLRAEKRHEEYARRVAGKIVTYQTQYPGRPVNLVGYSAGAVVAVEAIEALPAGRQVDRTILLAGAISPLYDLRVAIQRSRDGIVNYYQTQDVVALWAGTTLMGTADGSHLPSAGAVGFWPPLGASDDDRRLYQDSLVQLAYTPRMALNGNFGGHFQCVGRSFVAEWISPMLSGHPGSNLAQGPTRALR